MRAAEPLGTSAREGLAAEIADNDEFLSRRVAVAQRIDQKLDRIAQMIADIDAGRQSRMLVTRFNGLGQQLYDNDWQAEQI